MAWIERIRIEPAGKHGTFELGLNNSAIAEDTINNRRLYQDLPSRWTRVFRVLKSDPLHVLLQSGSLIDSRNGVEARFGLSVPEINFMVGYTAISYTWGDETDCVDITVEDMSGTKETRTVTKSLVAAVRQFSKHVGYLWMDQISIDQNSPTEKAHQIAMMKDIYEHAAKVWVWLGGAVDSQNLALSMVRQCVNAYRGLLEQCSNADGIPDFDLLRRQDLPHLLESFPRSYWQALERYFGAAWFRRAWIRQEVTAKEDSDVKVFCGLSAVTLDELYSFAQMMQLLAEGVVNQSRLTLFANLASLLNIFNFYGTRTSDQPIPLMKLLCMLRNTDAKDPRDKVYCILPFASDIDKDGPGPLLHPDYCIEYTASQERVPRWCPDWAQSSVPHFHRLTYGYEYDSEPIFFASGRTSMLPHIGIPTTFDQDLLHVEGILIGKVGLISPYMGLDNANDMISSWTKDAGEKLCPLNMTSRATVLGHTIVGDRRYVANVEAKRRNLLGHCVDVKQPLSIGEADEVGSTVRCRRLFYTAAEVTHDRGLLGLGPGEAKTGDEIWVLKGGRMLYILRRFSIPCEGTLRALDLTGGPHHVVDFKGGEGFHTFVGESFIKGLMEGQVLDMIGDNPARQAPECLKGMGHDFEKLYIF
ncbi:hypothetical protein LTR10_019890 [Elasticomyces elasticus]|uniref:Heterokaryon incompatibility domain-containing protein n=1 Tax=Exophiala sideris TaxID=1016849 RepID=A0ABR0IZK0_9EURO|nr:hypothetical protein LTR10_019890 [Elasticomyces elasticus]KAK5022386.1 hypothetical protein LTS07_010046 [Exophiala sideris]KAK5027256.1 hypothetical protein LTR13_009651 [Exophiala sideris]KAK5051240.1 hypothetical protein LTR69_010266 [Exophiala sideris]KAK5177796.1 hypothetical protein LTR44_009771 [Eurotiomycetes sp. CCFEE 6388]